MKSEYIAGTLFYETNMWMLKWKGKVNISCYENCEFDFCSYIICRRTCMI